MKGNRSDISKIQVDRLRKKLIEIDTTKQIIGKTDEYLANEINMKNDIEKWKFISGILFVYLILSALYILFICK